MLNKECCKKCLKKYWEDGFGWTEYDEMEWEKRGNVLCPEEYREERHRNINNKPPIKCPYYLENII